MWGPLKMSVGRTLVDWDYGSCGYLRDDRIAAPAARCRDPSELNIGAHGNDAALWQAEEIYRALRRA